MDPIITNALMTFGAGFTGAALSKAEGPGQVLDDMMTLVGFEKLHEVAEKKRAMREQNIKEYKNSIATEIAKIQEENIQEPPLSIVGPALEASKYYVEEDELRSMFATLIASSMDKSKEDKTHPSFVEIIKQLSTLDAKILLSFKNSHSHPIGKLIEERPNGYFVIVDNFYLHETIENYYLPDISASVSNLTRLGLIEITDQEIIKSEYFMNNKTVTSYINSRINIDKSVLKMKSKRLDVTPYGKNFIWSCIY